jgi:hypothetical protein
MSVLLSQTRSIWISSLLAVPIAFLVFKQKGIIKKALLTPLFMIIVFLGVMIAMHYTHPAIDPQNIVVERLRTFIDQDLMFRSTITRRLALKAELEEWSKGSFIFGRGLTYYANYYFDRVGKYRIAWGHLGHVTTLAQLGLIGLFVYSLFLPLKIVHASKKLWEYPSTEIKFMGIIGGVCIISSWICFFMSDSFLSQRAVEGIIFGAVWRSAIVIQKKHAEERAIIPFQIVQETPKLLTPLLRNED